MSDPLRWSKFYWSDWATDPKLAECSLAAKGLWMEILCEMARHDPPGCLEVDTWGVPLSQSIRHVVGEMRSIRRWVAQLIDRQVCDIKDGYMISRRMVRDWHKIQEGQKAAAKRWGKKSSKTPNGSGNGSANTTPNDPEVQDSQESKRSVATRPPRAHARATDRPQKSSRNGFIELARSGRLYDDDES